jgi:fatty acid synthase subunit alpha, fungi type
VKHDVICAGLPFWHSSKSNHPEARLISVTNSSEGKIVEVKVHRDRFVDYENTFDTTEEPDYLVHLETDADVGVLQSKDSE